MFSIKSNKFAKDKIKGKTLNKGEKAMIRKIAWETFKNTGDINTFIELKQIENIEKEIEENHSNNTNIYFNNEDVKDISKE